MIADLARKSDNVCGVCICAICSQQCADLADRQIGGAKAGVAGVTPQTWVWAPLKFEGGNLLSSLPHPYELLQQGLSCFSSS